MIVTPELCVTNGFRTKLGVIHQQGELNRIVVDEAHCISGKPPPSYPLSTKKDQKNTIY
jgi:hypothetical protein